MKIKFNKFERVAGIFVLTAIVGSLAAMVGVAVKRGWFEPKVELETKFQTADGIHIGTVVQMSGLRAGAVEAVELLSGNEIRVVFRVAKRFHERIRSDSVVRVMRPFIIGEKVLDISVGSESEKVVAGNGVLISEEGTDIMDLLNGRKLGPYLTTMSRMLENLKVVADAFLDPERSKMIVNIFDDLRPLMRDMSSMARDTSGLIRETTKKKRLVVALDNLVLLTNEMTRVLPEFTRNSPELAADLAKIAKNSAILTEEMQKFVPLMSKMAPEIPHASARALEALDETVITLKALQKSFVLRGSVKEVREEEAKRGPAGERKEGSSQP